MQRVSRLSVLATLIAFGACDEPAARNLTAPDGTASASKQSTTSSQMLVAVNPPPWIISRINDDGTGLLPLTEFGDDSFDAAWAPDGKHVLTANAIGIFVMNADGTGKTRLTFPVLTGDASPSAFEKRIVFTRGTAGFNSVYTMNADGTGITQVTDGGDDRQPSGSPKGNVVVFVRNDDIFSVDVATGGVTNLTNTPDQNEGSPAFSPSGKLIAFSRSDEHGLAGGIFVMNDDGTQLTHLTDGADDHPKWSPDGKRIAFDRFTFVPDPQDPQTGTLVQSIYTMNVDGSALTPLVPGNTGVFVLLAWAR